MIPTHAPLFNDNSAEISAPTTDDDLARTKQRWIRHLLDKPHPWRPRRYSQTLESIKKALLLLNIHPESIAEKAPRSISSLHAKLRQTTDILYAAHFLDPCLHYKSFQKALRKTICCRQYQRIFKQGYWNPEDAGAIYILHNIAYALMTSVDLDDLCHDVVNLFERAGRLSKSASTNGHLGEVAFDTPFALPVAFKDFLKSFTSTYEKIRSAPVFVKKPALSRLPYFLRGRFNCGFDPHAQENLPYRLFSHRLTTKEKRQKQVIALRMGSPTQERVASRGFKACTVNPEFFCFLQSIRCRRQKHLYINLQMRRSRPLCANEAPRSQCLEKLPCKFEGTLYTLSLAKNSAFYHQRGQFERLEKSERFIASFLQQMRKKNGHYHFPQPFAEHEHEIENMLHEVHKTYFCASDQLSRLERLDFIEIFYSHLQLYFLTLLQVDTYNITCRDGIDRAGAANALFYLFVMLKEKKPSDIDGQKIKAMLFAPAIFVRKRAIRPSRLKRFLSTAERLIDACSPPCSSHDAPL